MEMEKESSNNDIISFVLLKIEKIIRIKIKEVAYSFWIYYFVNGLTYHYINDKYFFWLKQLIDIFINNWVKYWIFEVEKSVSHIKNKKNVSFIFITSFIKKSKNILFYRYKNCLNKNKH